MATLTPPFYSDLIVRCVDCYPVADKGCSIINDGQRTPNINQGFATNAINIIWFNWSDHLEENEEISLSEMILPDSMELLGRATGQSVTDSSEFVYPSSNAARINFGATAGTYQIVNKVTTTRNGSAGRVMYRAAIVSVRSYV